MSHLFQVVTHFLLTFFLNFKTALSRTDIIFHFLFHKQSDTCPNDYVEVLEGSYGSTDSIKRLCGESLSFDTEYRTVRSKGSSLLVHLHTDDANENRGFAASHQGEYNLIFNIFNLLPWLLGITIHGLNEISLLFMKS